MMVTPMATMEGGATAEATMDMAGATTEATMDMSTPMADATMDATMDMSTPMADTTTEAGTGAAMTEPMCFVVYLSGANSVPVADPDGYGVAAISVDPTTNTVTFDVAVAGITLPATAAHIHKGAAGENGPVVVPANGAPDANGMQNSTSDAVDAALIQDILANPAGYYYNVHTEDFPNGAIRGQLAGMMGMSGDMSGTMMPTADMGGATMDATADMSGTAMAPSATP